MRIGLALSGGGAKGLAHIGVLKVLEELQMPVDLLSGTSMGGVVAAVYAAGRPAAEIEHLARSLRLLDIVHRDRSGLGLMGQEKITHRLREALRGDPTFDQLKLPLALVAVDLETGEEVIIREGSVIEGVLATTAVPFVFPPLEWRGRLLVDGAVLNPLPFDVLRPMGAERVIAVHALYDLSGELGADVCPGGRGVEAVIRVLLHRTPLAPMIEVAERCSEIMSLKLVEQRAEEAPPDLMIEIPFKGIGLFDLDQVGMCLEAGEAAARRREAELIALRDAPPPGLLERWWRALRRRLSTLGEW